MLVQSKVGDAVQLAETILPTLRGLCGWREIFCLGVCGKKSATDPTDPPKPKGSRNPPHRLPWALVPHGFWDGAKEYSYWLGKP